MRSLARLAALVATLLIGAGCHAASAEDDGGTTTMTTAETTTTRDGAQVVELADLVPGTLTGVDLRVRNPSIEQSIGQDPLLDLAWGEVTRKWKAAQIVDVVDKTAVCFYETEVATAGIYGVLGSAPKVLAVGAIIPGRMLSLDLGLCLARKAFRSFTQADEEPEPQACAGTYETETSGGTTYVAYAAVGFFDAGSDPCGGICAELVGCGPSTRE